MAAFAMPSHVYDAPLFPGTFVDPSQMDHHYSFDDLFADSQQGLINPTLNIPLDSRDHLYPQKRQASPASSSAFFYNHHHQSTPPIYPQTSASTNSASSSHLSSPMISRGPTLHCPDAWHSRDGEFSHLHTAFGPNAMAHSDIDYPLLAGENSGSGVGECRRIPSSSPSVSQSCLSDVAFASPSTSSSFFRAPSEEFGAGTELVVPPPPPGTRLVGPTLSTTTSDGAVFKAPLAPASATSAPRRARSITPTTPQSWADTPIPGDVPHIPGPAAYSSPFSVLPPLNRLSVSPQVQHLEDLSFSGGALEAPPNSSYPSQLQIPTPNSAATPPFLPAPHSYTYPLSPAVSQASHNVINNAQPRGSPYSSATWPMERRPSVHSVTSRSQGSPRSGNLEFEEESRERTLCPYPDCGKSFKDLKAHMLTHQNERPEKCPITSCEFHKRGFARKYDRNRHLVTTHYKATIICGFCPGSGSSAEKSFNRTDVFKRHLVAVHGVEQNPSNAKKNSKDSTRPSPRLSDNVTGKCSTCGHNFPSAQALFEHLDDCVLRVVTQTDPCEIANEKNLRSMADDSAVKATMERHAIPNDLDSSYPSSAIDDCDDISDEVEEKAGRSGRGSIKSSKAGGVGTSLHGVNDGGISKNSNRNKDGAGLTYSKGGVALPVGKGRKKRKHYPQSWGCSTDKMKLKKRVLCVFDGQRRLWKDDMMLGNDYEVRVNLPDGEGYVTDLDVETMKRANAFHDSTEEERGPWMYTNYPDWNQPPPQMLT